MSARSPKILPPVEFLRECFDYNPESGILKWRVRPRGHFKTEEEEQIWNAVFAGKRPGAVNKGYLVICLQGTPYLAHSIVVKLVTGIEPPPSLDHADLTGLNNRLSNLRSATQREQQWNRGLRKSNTSGFRGVSRNGGGWRARINENGVYLSLGTYGSPEEAALVYEAEACRLHGNFYREPEYVAALKLGRRGFLTI
jgi:hypothetical protein